MVDAALPRAGLLPVAWNVRAWQDKSWTRTNHDLDRVYRGKGVNFGVEVKNTLAYIDREELTHKLAMCRELQLVTLFVMRMAPASYIELVRQQGGFTWLFEWQLYPFGHEDFAREVQEGLGYKVGCPRALEQGTVDRLVKWLSRHGYV